MRSTSFIGQLAQVNRAAWTMYNANPLNVKKLNMSPANIAGLFNVLAQNKVKYILIGGFAMAFHGHVRATMDIDLWVRNDPDNMEALKKPLSRWV